LNAAPVDILGPPPTRLPIVESDFTRRQHPACARVRETTKQWLLDTGLMEDAVAHTHTDALLYTELIAGYYVGAPEPALQAISDFSSWFFVWDDFHNNAASHRDTASWTDLDRQLRQVTRAPHEHGHHPRPFASALADALLRLNACLGPAWSARFAGHFLPILDAYTREFRERIDGIVPTPADYLEHRRHTFGHWVWLDLLEVAADHELPAHIRDSELYRRAGLASQDFSALYNDLYSLPKELAAGETHNYATTLIRHDGLTEAQAIAQLRARILECIDVFLGAEPELDELAGGLQPPVSDALRSCVFNMRNWISSVYWFHHESGRYRMADWLDPALPPYVDTYVFWTPGGEHR
jgi:epi-isozizaene synthase